MVLLSSCTPAGPRAVLEGKRLLDRGKPEQAVGKLKLATSLLPTNAQAWNYLGLACHYTLHSDDAERAYKRALALNQDLSEAHYNLACLWLSQNRPDKTEAAKTELLAYTLRRGNSVEGFLKLGLAQLRLHELTGAEKSFSDALRLSAQNPEALNGLGLVRLQRGRVDEAAKYFRAALQQAPPYAPALLNLGIVAQEMLKDRLLALKAYQQYAALNPAPADAESVRNLARQLERELNPPAAPVPQTKLQPSNAPSSLSRTPATNAFRPPNSPVLAKPTNNVPPPSNKGATAPAVTPPAAIIAAPSRIQTSNPVGQQQIVIHPSPSVSATEANLELVQLSPEPELKPGREIANLPVSEPVSEPTPAPEPMLARPLSDGRLARSTEPKRSLLQRLNPFNLFREEKKSTIPTPLPPVTETPQPEPLAVATLAAQNAPARPPANMPTGRYTYHSPARPETGNRAEAQRFFDQGVQAQQGLRLAEAIHGYQQAILADPSFFEAQYNLGLAAAESGDWALALSSYELALAIRPESLDARYNFALALQQANYYLDAANELEKALATSPNDARANLAVANLYSQQLQQPARARPHYVKVLEADPHNPQASKIRYWLVAHPE